MNSSVGSVRTFSPDGHTFSPDGLQLRDRSDHWKKPIDSDQGGADDPPNVPGHIFKNRTYHPSYWHNPHHYGDGSTPPLACRGHPGGG